MAENSRPLVLVADDHPVNQKIMGVLLERMWVDVSFACNGVEAVDAVKAQSYALIFMDIMMPEMDGFEAAFRIRMHEFERGRHTPIIACTALDKERVKEQCVRSGMDDFINKPISRETVREKIENWARISLDVLESADEALNRVLKKAAAEEKALEDPINRSELGFLYGIEQLDDVLVLFMTVTETLMAQLESALEHRDITLICRMAHEIKGSSYTVSAREMAQLCLRLERIALEQDWSEAERLYAALGLAFARVREFLSVKRECI